ncbi:MAG TPA: type II secretion system protein [Albitalea sp.]|nr:type II secretion system protein [Albitalea sp.]
MVALVGFGAIRGRRRSGGFTYLGVLLAIALIGIGLVAASEVWVTSVRRQKAEELEWVGAQFTQAIGSYYQSTPGAAKAYPTSLQDLLEDRRYVTMRRHLRAIYSNPFTGKADWEIVKGSDGRMRGVRAVVATDTGSRSFEFVYVPGARF